MIRHKSIAYVKAIEDRGLAQPDPITQQFRFIIRLAVACHGGGVPYEIEWALEYFARMRATITVSGRVPTPKHLPKAPQRKLVVDWRPDIWDAEYRLDAYSASNPIRRHPGFVIAHSCGLSLVHPSDSGEFGVGPCGVDEDIRQNWSVTHTASGGGFGLKLNFKRGRDALLLAASFPVDWTQDPETLRANPEARLVRHRMVAAYGRGRDREISIKELQLQVPKGPKEYELVEVNKERCVTNNNMTDGLGVHCFGCDRAILNKATKVGMNGEPMCMRCYMRLRRKHGVDAMAGMEHPGRIVKEMDDRAESNRSEALARKTLFTLLELAGKWDLSEERKAKLIQQFATEFADLLEAKLYLEFTVNNEQNSVKS